MSFFKIFAAAYLASVSTAALVDPPRNKVCVFPTGMKIDDTQLLQCSRLNDRSVPGLRGDDVATPTAAEQAAAEKCDAARGSDAYAAGGCGQKLLTHLCHSMCYPAEMNGAAYVPCNNAYEDWKTCDADTTVTADCGGCMCAAANGCEGLQYNCNLTQAPATAVACAAGTFITANPGALATVDAPASDRCTFPTGVKILASTEARCKAFNSGGFEALAAVATMSAEDTAANTKCMDAVKTAKCEQAHNDAVCQAVCFPEQQGGAPVDTPCNNALEAMKTCAVATECASCLWHGPDSDLLRFNCDWSPTKDTTGFVGFEECTAAKLVAADPAKVSPGDASDTSAAASHVLSCAGVAAVAAANIF